MLDRDLARLAATPPDLSLVGLEQAVWSKVEGMKRLRRHERVISGVQIAALAAGLVASTAVGVSIAQSPSSHRTVLQISSVADRLAPSTLLGASR